MIFQTNRQKFSELNFCKKSRKQKKIKEFYQYFPEISLL